jgi:hypothetical protein
MVSKPTGRPAHRPKIPVRQHPDGRRIALSNAMLLLGMKSEHKAALVTILFSEACREAHPRVDIAVPPSGHIAISFEKFVSPGASHTLRGRAENIRKKWSRWAPCAQDEKWLLCMTIALALCLDSKVHCYATKQMVRNLASKVGESLFAEKTLIPMIDVKAARLLYPE